MDILNKIINMFQNSHDNIFQSKSTVLKLLENNLKFSKIEKLYFFTISEWQLNDKKIIDNIQNNFKNSIIIRSSAIGEDSIENSHAGEYLSIPNINPKNYNILKASINKVISSYRKKSNFNLDNLVLIQTFSTDIVYSGVIFSYQSNGSPYYIINYEKGNNTDGVTKGIVGNTIKIFRELNLKNMPNEWKKLIKSVNEIEKFLKFKFLDIEFGINKNDEIIIFQVRPITSMKNYQENTKIDFKKIITQNKNKFQKINSEKKIIGNKTIFSDMADWNPAEIIGNEPKNLDYSLYDFLIMDSVWHKSRTILGYKNLNKQKLMRRFGNKPYVDTRASFNSLIPNNLNLNLQKKLMNFYLKKLKNNPHLHDKVEFEILFTCYEPFIKKRLNELKNYGFTKSEIRIIERNLLSFTNSIIKNFCDVSKECINSVEKMRTNRIKILNNYNRSSKTYKDKIFGAKLLLNDCKSLGTVKFSIMARIAFISSIIFKSLIFNGKISNTIAENFMNSLESPLSKFQNDLEQLNQNIITKNEFLKKYGHLRAGTYDITALRYDQDSSLLNELSVTVNKKKKNYKKLSTQINSSLQKSKLIFKEVDFYNFLKNSLTQREELKFEFTKNLSQAIELIAQAGIELNFSREDMSFITLNQIFKDIKKFDKKKLIQQWKKIIYIERCKRNKLDLLILPPIIFSEKNLDIIEYFVSKPNFITRKKLLSEIIHINNISRSTVLDNKIILLENADPGFDWIFSKGLSGLITKYGGVASHMAIRCSELKLPAAIGCGELLYDNLISSSKILLDCENQQIIILKNQKYDKFTNEKKLLKSLGYIR